MLDRGGPVPPPRSTQTSGQQQGTLLRRPQSEGNVLRGLRRLRSDSDVLRGSSAAPTVRATQRRGTLRRLHSDSDMRYREEDNECDEEREKLEAEQRAEADRLDAAN